MCPLSAGPTRDIAPGSTSIETAGHVGPPRIRRCGRRGVVAVGLGMCGPGDRQSNTGKAAVLCVVRMPHDLILRGHRVSLTQRGGCRRIKTILTGRSVRRRRHLRRAQSRRSARRQLQARWWTLCDRVLYARNEPSGTGQPTSRWHVMGRGRLRRHAPRPVVTRSFARSRTTRVRRSGAGEEGSPATRSGSPEPRTSMP
jgi:hypothetical protein